MSWHSERRMRRRTPAQPPMGWYWAVTAPRVVPAFATYYLVEEGMAIDAAGFYDPQPPRGKSPVPPWPMPKYSVTVSAPSQVHRETGKLLRRILDDAARKQYLREVNERGGVA